MKELPAKLLKMLCCPKCKSNLRYDRGKSLLRCESCKKNFKIKEGIPVLLP
ncbi:Trm112 family protein [Candidatus Woesearchaeota archaeon]|nr:Trm112 family protein [Candidatus Woesearchaeota archaeon]